MKCFLLYKINQILPCEVISEPKLNVGFHGSKWSPLKLKLTEATFLVVNDEPIAFKLVFLDDEGFVIKDMHFSDVNDYDTSYSKSEISIKFGYLAINY